MSMKIAYVTHYNAKDVTKWSGLGYYIADSLIKQSISLDYVGPLEERQTYRFFRKCKSKAYSLAGKKYIKDTDFPTLKYFAFQAENQINKLDIDFIVSPTLKPVAFLNSEKPIAFWTDATFDGMLDFYPAYKDLCQESLKNGHSIQRSALENATLAIYSSDWAANSAIQKYGANSNKIRVVPLGANLDTQRNIEDIKVIVQSRPRDQCKLLFIGVEWFRKGGDIALNVARSLNEAGLPTTLTIVGCQPVTDEPLPNFVSSLGFISKASLDGRKKIEDLIAESHFLIMPSRAECYGIVFCEANSFGVPCLAAPTGGIPTVIKNNVNGMLFPIRQDISEYCEFILNLFSKYQEYESLAISSFNEYYTRLNWDVAGKTVKRLLEEI